MMMKAKNVRSIICLVIFFLFVNQVWAKEWLYYDTAPVGDMYYDKSRIKKVNKNITSVWTKNIFCEEAKTKYFSILKSIRKAPDNPSLLSYYVELMEIDFANKKIKDVSAIFYNQQDKVIYSTPKSESGQWNDIVPNSPGEKLYNIISWEPVVSDEIAEASKVEEAVTRKEAVDASTTVTDKNLAQVESNQAVTPKKAVVAVTTVTNRKIAQVKSNQNETKAIPKEAVPNLVTKAINSSKSGDMETNNNPENLKIADKKSKSLVVSRPLVTVREKARDGRFIAYDNQTVQDTGTKLMWAAKDNGDDINWQDAKNYCERYRGGGYTDWRMPTRDELAGLYNANKTQRNKAAQNPLHLTKLIYLTSCCPWTSETRDSNAAFFDFNDGTVWWFLTSSPRINRALPVRSAK
jgi:hypothetical protein